MGRLHGTGGGGGVALCPQGPHLVVPAPLQSCVWPGQRWAVDPLPGEVGRVCLTVGNKLSHVAGYLKGSGRWQSPREASSLQEGGLTSGPGWPLWALSTWREREVCRGPISPRQHPFCLSRWLLLCECHTCLARVARELVSAPRTDPGLGEWDLGAGVCLEGG